MSIIVVDLYKIHMFIWEFFFDSRLWWERTKNAFMKRTCVGISWSERVCDVITSIRFFISRALLESHRFFQNPFPIQTLDQPHHIESRSSPHENQERNSIAAINSQNHFSSNPSGRVQLILGELIGYSLEPSRNRTSRQRPLTKASFAAKNCNQIQRAPR